ncbi:MAG: VOC family protein [Betaproteobacteria bacterium]
MSDLNAIHNRAVWFDIPVASLDRASAFYSAVMAIKVHKQEYPGGAFCILDHGDGNGGCLVEGADMISRNGGILVYLNTEGRIQDAVAQVTKFGGEVLEATHPIGPHGFRAIVRDCEGNRLALHSSVDQ